MSLNTANTADGRGVIIYNGEIILLFVREVNMSFDKCTHLDFKGTKKGNLYLTSHRIIFNNTAAGTTPTSFKSLSMPFSCIREVKLEQPIFGANYLAGELIAQPDGNWGGQTNWKLTFNRGGCIDFGQALLKTSDMANTFCPRPLNAPPPYAPPAGTYYSPPPEYYWTGGQYQGYQAPTHVFTEQPPAGSVFMYEQPPPYAGIGPMAPPRNQPIPNNPPQQQQAVAAPTAVYPQLHQNGFGGGPSPSAPPAYSDNNIRGSAGAGSMAPLPSYDQATALPSKPKID